MLNFSNFYPKIKGLFYVVNPTPMGVGDLKSENPGVPGAHWREGLKKDFEKILLSIQMCS